MKSERGWIAALMCAMAFATPAGAQIYHCKDGHGKTTYQEAPCSPAAGQTRVADAPSFEKKTISIGKTFAACMS